MLPKRVLVFWFNKAFRYTIVILYFIQAYKYTSLFPISKNTNQFQI